MKLHQPPPHREEEVARFGPGEWLTLAAAVFAILWIILL